MALTNYTELVDTIKSYTHRKDLDSVVPDCIKLAEVRIARDLKLQPLQSSVNINVTAGTRTYAIDSNVISIERIYITDSDGNEELIGASADLIAYDEVTGKPNAYYVEKDSINLYPMPDKSYTVTIVYSGGLNLQTSTTNTIMTRFPNIYLSASLVEVYAYVGTEASVNKGIVWEQRYKQAVKDANRAENFKENAVLMTDLPLGRNRYDFNNA